MKWKNPGISLFVTMGISFAVLGLAMAIIVSISKSLEQTTALERSNQVFLAAESGVEAALYHHNARGAGVSFISNNASQEIEHEATNTKVSWIIDGRTHVEDGQAAPVIGLLKENQRVEISFAYDPSSNPTESLSKTGQIPANFEVKFYNSIADNESEGSIEEKIYETFGEFDFNSSNFLAEDDDVLIDWGFSGTHNDQNVTALRPEGKRESFVPTLNGDSVPCEGNGTFLCVGNTFDVGAALDQTTEGKIIPYEGGSELTETLQTFSNEHSGIKFSFLPLQKFEDELGDKIRGIPFSISTGNVSIPRDSYTITSEITVGDFTKTISLDVKEKTSIGAFDYVIFD